MREQDIRTAELFGEEAVARLRSAHVCVFGIGGVGSYTVEALARASVGALTVIDADTVAPSNINRQLIATHSTLGRDKVAVARERILDISPDTKVGAIKEFATPENLSSLIPEDVDYVVDAIDSVTTKIALAQYCEQKHLPLISSMGTGNKSDPSRFEICDIYKTSVCPLARVMRTELRRRGVKGLKVLYSKEEPRVAAEKKGRTPASCSFVPSVAGLMIAGEVIRDLIGR